MTASYTMQITNQTSYKESSETAKTYFPSKIFTSQMTKKIAHYSKILQNKQ